MKAGWSQSNEWRTIARNAITRFNQNRHTYAKCGAMARGSGLPCRNVAMANGRCRFHGGRTPKGDGWHKPVWPKGTAPNAERKLAGKLRQLESARKEREQRLAEMDPEQLAAYERWRQQRPVGPAVARKAKANRRRQDKAGAELLAMLTDDPAARSTSALDDKIARLEADLAALTAQRAPAPRDIFS